MSNGAERAGVDVDAAELGGETCLENWGYTMEVLERVEGSWAGKDDTG